MIKIQKLAEPKILSDNANQWLRELQDALAAGDQNLIKSRKSRYNHPDIKAAVKLETHGKCAFCECDVAAVAYGDIEHLFPKSLNINKTFEWSNLGFACQICNQNKSDRDPNLENILDPYNVDPEPFIVFYAAFINSNGTKEGRQTIHHLKLDRAEVFERRQKIIQSLIKNIELINSAKTPEEKSILIEDFENNELRQDLEFTAMRRDFWKAFRPVPP